jgi:hypothetical protein
MPTKTIAELKALVDTRLPTNNAGAIDAATLRSVIDDILDNEQVALSGILTTAGTPNSTTFLRGDNVWAAPTTGGTFSGTGDPGLTRAQAAATTFTTPPNAIRTTGYGSTPDLGGGLYVKVTSQPSHAGKFQTVDGTWYELMHDGRVWAAQFGALTTVTAWNAKENSISDALTAAVDYINFNRFGPCDLHIHSGTYYMDKTVNLKGDFNIRGSAGKGGTYIMPDNYVTAFVGHHQYFSFDVFGSLYFNNRSWELGEPMYTSQGVPGTPSGHAYICTQAGTSSADGSGKPTGTGTNYIDGTAKFDYLREANRVELQNKAWVGEMSNLTLYSHFQGTAGGSIVSAQTNAPAVGPWPQFSSGVSYTYGPWKPAFGFLGRQRSHIHHCDMWGFPAHGCAFIANGDFDFPTITGNVNFWCVTDCTFYYNAMDGLHASYSDGNAGYAAHIDVSGNGRWGIRDQSFLGNMYVQVQSATDGRASLAWDKRFNGSVTYNGRRYYAKLGRIGTSGIPDWGATAPSGTSDSNAAWAYAGGDGTWTTDNWDYPDWVSGHHYEPSGCYGSDNVNARNVWNSCYIEGGTAPAQFNARDIVIGGQLGGQFITAGSNLLSDGNWYNPINYASRVHDFGVALGGGSSYDSAGEGILFWRDGVNEYTFRTDSYGNSGATYQTDNYVWAIDASSKGYWIKNGQTSKTYGRSAASAVGGGSFAFHNLFLGSDGNCRQWDTQDAAPTGGTWAKGDYVKNRNATVGQPKGWYCTVAGTPGTWVSEGNL